jgi:hypothetical protein
MDPLPIPIMKVRGLPVLLDYDLARLYGVPVIALNQSVKRNQDRFPEDFAFQSSVEEWANLKSQFVISRLEVVEDQDSNPSQPAAGSPRRTHGGRRTPPRAFTEHGALMAANVLRSPAAIRMSVFIIRAIVKQREALSTNAEILLRLHDIDRALLEHDDALRDLYEKLLPLLTHPDPPRRLIGFQQAVEDRNTRKPGRDS